MRGHIVKRGKDSYSIVISMPYDPKTGHYPQTWVTVKGGKREAEKKLAELQYQIDSGTLAQPGKVSLAAFLERWLKDYATPNLSPRTVEGYRTIIENHLIPSLGHYPLQKLTSAKIAEYYRERQQQGRKDGKGGLSSTTVRQHAMVLHKAYETAIEWELAARNPADKVKIPRPAYHEWTPFDATGARQILEASRNHALYPVFHLAMGSGMRRSEIMALRWCDVDLERSAIYVTRTLHQLHTREYVIRPPKTAAGKRTVKLTPEMVDVLRRHRAQREAQAVMLGTALHEQGLIFANADSSHIRPDYVSSVWRNFAKKCGLTGVRFHDARHLHATLLLKKGIHPKLVQSRLGHGSVKVTMDIYSHVMEDMQDIAIADFDGMIFTKQPEEDSAKNS